MKYFGIKTPHRVNKKSYIWWIASDEHLCWMSFFQYPDKNNKLNSHRMPLEEAIRAYEAIGYKCVELEVKEKGRVKKERETQELKGKLAKLRENDTK